MKIIKLQAENIKKIKAIEITPNSNIVQITGANAQGKTSVLDCIWFALAGKNAITSNPIRNGENNGSIEVSFDAFKVVRKFKLKDDGEITTSLVVENKEGAKYGSPQSMLDDLLGRLTFDPLGFSRLKAKEQFSLLCDVAKIDYDFAGEAEKKKTIYDERTVINRTLTDVEAQAKAIAVDDSLSKEKLVISKLLDELKNMDEQNSSNAALRSYIDELSIKTGDAILEKAKLENKLSAICNEISELESLSMVSRANLVDNISTDELKKQLSQAEQINANIDNIAKKSELREKYKEQKIASQKKTDELAAIDIAKIKALSESKMPVDGMGVETGEVCYNGVPFEQLSGSEKLRISLAIAAATNPKIRVIRITDGSLLDKNSMLDLERFANENDLQIWIERVDESGQIGICIEDGEIK